MDDLSGVPPTHLDECDPLAVIMTLLLAASSGASRPGGIAGHLLNIHGTIAYLAVGILVFAEVALMLGFFIPGETAAVVGGALAGLGRVNLVAVMVVVVACAVAGDCLGFQIGRWAGPWLLDHRPLKGRRSVDSTVDFLDHYGGPAVFLGRFVPFVRAIVPGLAGMSDIGWRTFLFWNVLGGTIWGVAYTLLGYVAGVSFTQVLRQVGLWALAVVGVVVLVAVVFHLLRMRRLRRREPRPAGDPAEVGQTPVG